MSKIVIVDENDEVIGSEDKEIAFQKGLIRRIVRTFVFNSMGELFLQRRSSNKDTYPNTWDQSAGGHVDEGETYEEAARRELKEELGVNTHTLERITKFYKEQEFKRMILKEFSTLFTTVFNGDIMPNKKELSGGKWFDLKRVEKMLKENPKEFPPGFIEAFNRYLIMKKRLSSN